MRNATSNPQQVFSAYLHFSFKESTPKTGGLVLYSYTSALKAGVTWPGHCSSVMTRSSTQRRSSTQEVKTWVLVLTLCFLEGWHEIPWRVITSLKGEEINIPGPQTTKLASCDTVIKHLHLVIQTCSGIPLKFSSMISGKVPAWGPISACEVVPVTICKDGHDDVVMLKLSTARTLLMVAGRSRKIQGLDWERSPLCWVTVNSLVLCSVSSSGEQRKQNSLSSLGKFTLTQNICHSPTMPHSLALMALAVSVK